MATYFKPAQSQQYAPRYAPIPLDAVRFGVQQANQTRQEAATLLDRAMATEDQIRSSLSPSNRAAAEEILEQNRAFLDRLADPETDVRYADMIPLIRRRVRQSSRQLQPYIEDSARIQQFREELKEGYNAGRITNAQRMRALRQIGNYRGLQFDDEGQPLGFSSPTIVNDVNLQGQAEDLAEALRQGNKDVILNEFGADPRFVQKITQEGITPEEAIPLIREQLLLNPDNQAFIEAELQAVNYLREENGQEPLSRTEFMNRQVLPAAMQAGRRSFDFIRNPGFSVSSGDGDGGGFGGRTREIEIGNALLDFTSPAELTQKRREITEQLEVMPQQLMGRLDPELREQARVVDGRIQVDNPVIGGVNRQQEIDALNAQIEQAELRKSAYDSFDEDLRAQANLDDVNPEKMEQVQDLIEANFENWMYIQGRDARPRYPKLSREEHWDKFRETGAYDDALESIAKDTPEYAEYMRLFEEEAGKQGQFKVSVPAQIEPKAQGMLIDELKAYGIGEELENAMTREPYTREEAAELINNAEEIIPLGPASDTNMNRTYLVYQIYSEDEEPVRVMLPAQGVGGWAALRGSGLGATLRDGIGQQIYNLSTAPGGESTVEIPINPDAGDGATESPKIRVHLYSPSEQNRKGYKYGIDLPFGNNSVDRENYKSEPEVISRLEQYFNAYYERNK